MTKKLRDHGASRMADEVHTCTRFSGVSLSRLHPARVLWLAGIASAALVLTGCDSNAPATPSMAGSSPAAEAKPTEPPVPPEVQAVADSLLGSETKVLAFGDLAHNGKQEVLAANVLPKTPSNAIPGTVVTRTTIAEKNDDGKWMEVFHCDEHLKNAKGLLSLTPRESVSSWRLQFEQDQVKGLRLYFTPEHTGDSHVLPIGVGYNPKAKRYQSLDRTFENFLPEAASMGEPPRSSLRK
jgi:hypothetical protein